MNPKISVLIDTNIYVQYVKGVQILLNKKIHCLHFLSDEKSQIMKITKMEKGY